MYLCTPVCCQGCFHQTITGIRKSNNLTLAMIAINRLKASINQILGSFMWKMGFSQGGILVIWTDLLDLYKRQKYMSCLMTKPTKWVCASIDSDQPDRSLHCPHEETSGPKLPIKRTVKTLIRLGGCPGCSESLLGAHATLLVLSWDGSYPEVNLHSDYVIILALCSLSIFRYQCPPLRKGRRCGSLSEASSTSYATSFRKWFFAYHHAVKHPHTNIILSFSIPLVLKRATKILKIGLQIKI